jgi:hypothetical protein
MRDTKRPPSALRVLALCAFLLAAVACSTALRVDSGFPRPVVASLPIDAGVYYDDTFREYVFERQADAKSLAWRIEIGSAHVRLFDQLFHSLFENLVHLDGLAAENTGEPVGVVIKPSIDEYALHTPSGTSSAFYEVEIRYRLAFHSPRGDFIKHWSYTGRGRSRSTLFGSDEPVEKATVAAMRDAAAWLVIELTKHTDFHTLLQAQQSENENARDNHDS